MTIIHTADLHARKENAAELFQSLGKIEEAAKDADLVVLAGDTWDGPIQNTAGSMFPEFLERIRRIADRAPVAMIYGTPSHDTDGSLEVFESLHSELGIAILRPGKPYFLANGQIHEHPSIDDEALLFGVPEPNKKWLLANQGATGKDEADEAARTAIGRLFLGLGGMRREHPDLPCVLLYHGQVLGAKTATGYQAASGLAVSGDDLAAVGADYIALGDIHDPQQIKGLRAYYPGSAYPLNWGETHVAGANVVEIRRGTVDLFSGSPFEVEVSRLEFGHPQRVKLAYRWPSTKEAIDSPAALVGKLVWEEITCTREESAMLDIALHEHGLARLGALPGSRVTLNVLPVETVRAGEITEAPGLPEKIRVWAEASSLVAPPSVLTKAEELEREAASRGSGLVGAHIRIDRLVLRGAVGVWKKSRKDEIDLDLEALGPGVLALVGPNGAGKTTILENLHPWPCMLTRTGTLKDHFRLRDSCRDLYFSDERTGWRYRAYITIRAEIASGAAEYYLYRDTGSGYEPLPGINGRKEPYEAAVAELFGSLEMYLRTAFVTQRPSKAAPSLEEATQGQRKALFGELAGIDYLDGYREAAKARADALDRELVGISATINLGQGLEERLSTLAAEIGTAEGEARGADEAAELSKRRGATLSAERDAAAKELAAIEAKINRGADIGRELARLLVEIDQAESAIAGYQRAAEGRQVAEAELARIDELTARHARLRAEKDAIDIANRAALDGWRQVAEDREAQRRTLRSMIEGRRLDLGKEERKLAGLEARLTAPIVDHCPTCAQLLPEDKREHLAEERRQVEGQLHEVTLTHAALTDEIAEQERAMADIVTPARPPLGTFEGADELADIDADLAFADRETAEATIRKADEAAIRIEGARDIIKARSAHRDDLSAELARLNAEATGAETVRQTLRDLEEALASERARYTEARATAAGARASAEAARTARADIDTRIASRKAAEGARARIALELDDWRFIERAAGPNGIQALELDALAPSIAAVSNRILAEAYGSRYQVEFRTTRQAGKGSKSKQVEDFEILVLDTETGDEQAIDSLSGGEAVWIRKALYDGFGVIRAKNTGTRFQTVFLDEADGALDPEARMKYLRMLEAAHREAGRYQTILISHSTEIQAMVGQVVDVGALEARAEKEAAA